MNRFPRYGPPFQYYNPYYRNNFYPNYVQPNVERKQNTTSNLEKTSSTEHDNRKLKSSDTVWLDLFGIKLYFDDVLILSLLYFLYKEDVKDEGLFLALVMLLIS